MLLHHVFRLERLAGHADHVPPGALAAAVQDVGQERSPCSLVVAFALTLQERGAFLLPHRKQVAIDNVGGHSLMSRIDHVEVAHLFVSVDPLYDDDGERVVGQPLRLIVIERPLEAVEAVLAVDDP